MFTNYKLLLISSFASALPPHQSDNDLMGVVKSLYFVLYIPAKTNQLKENNFHHSLKHVLFTWHAHVGITETVDLLEVKTRKGFSYRGRLSSGKLT